MLSTTRREKWVWAGLYGAVVIGCLVVEPFEKGRFSICFFHTLTNLPCPGCGLTRSFVWLLHGDVVRSLTFNPFGLVIFAGWTWKTFVDTWDLITGREFHLLEETGRRHVRHIFVVSFLVFGILRMLWNAHELFLFGEWRVWLASL